MSSGARASVLVWQTVLLSSSYACHSEAAVLLLGSVRDAFRVLPPTAQCLCAPLQGLYMCRTHNRLHKQR